MSQEEECLSSRFISTCEEEKAVQSLYKLAQAYSAQYGYKRLLDDIKDGPRFVRNFTNDLCDIIGGDEPDMIGRLSVNIEESIASFVDCCYKYNKASNHQQLAWLQRYDLNVYALGLRPRGELAVIVEEAVKFAQDEVETDDGLKKRCRLIVRFFQRAYICEYKKGTQRLPSG